MSWDPITRIVGSLGIYTKIDFKQKTVAECYSTSSIFRGYSIFMKGKDPRDAHFITSRICGICGDNHATCSVYNQNMAYGVHPPALGEWIINLGEAAEYMFDHNIFQENLVGVDYCERMVKETNPGVLERANNTEAPHAGDHGYKTIGDIMRALNPLEGDFYREALQVSRYTREMFCLMEGRHVHPSTLYPGGVGTTATIQLFTDYLTRLMRYVEFMKRVVPLHDDLFDFFYEAMPGLRERRPAPHPADLLGRAERPGALRLQVREHDQLGPQGVRQPGRRRRRQARHQRPGRDQPRHPHPARQLVLPELGERADVRRARRARQPGRPQPPVEPDHASRSRRSATSTTSTAGSCRRAGSTARTTSPPTPAAARSPGCGRRRSAAWSTAATSSRPGTACVINLPKTMNKPEVTFEWKIPQWSNALERNRARTYFQAYAAACALYFCEQALAEVRAGHTKTWESFEVPDEAFSCGFTEAVRGVLSHHMVIKDGKIANYHPYPPTPWNASVRDVVRHARPVRGRGAEHADLRGEPARQLQGHRHHARGAQLRPVPAVRRAHVPRPRKDPADDPQPGH